MKIIKKNSEIKVEERGSDYYVMSTFSGVVFKRYRSKALALKYFDNLCDMMGIKTKKAKKPLRR